MKILSTTIKALFRKDDGRVLIVKSARDEYWELPGGKIEFGEQPEDTLRREVAEELGIGEFLIDKLVGTFSFLASDEGDDWHFTVMVFLCHFKNQNLKISKEHESYAWVLPEQVRTYPMRSGYYKIIEGSK